MAIKGSFNILTRVDSTNNYAMQMVHGGMAGNGMAWFTQEQTAGKGQRGRQWLAEPGQNIALSVVLAPQPLKNNHAFHLSMITGLACRAFFDAYTGGETLIKWPNDIYWCDRKAGGILIENVYHGKDWKWAIIGMGININQVVFDPAMKNPVSLKQITGKTFDAEALARELHTRLLHDFDQLCRLSTDALTMLYNSHLYGLNQPVRLKKENQVFETTIQGVSSGGQLLTKDTLERNFAFGEVEWIIG